MKIAFINNSTGWGGLEMNTLKLAKLLSEKEYQISLISNKNSTIYKKGEHVFSETLLLKNIKRLFDINSAKAISLFLKEKNINTIFVFDNKDIDVVAWIKILFDKDLTIIYQQHMQIGINKRDIFHTLRFKTIKYWISPLQYLKDEIALRTYFPVDRVKVIPLCMDISKFTYKKYTKQQALQLLNITPKAPLIGIIGRFSKKKGQLFLVECLLKLKQKGINIEILIVGSATINDPEGIEYYEQICKYVKDNNLEDVVHIKESNADVALFYNAVDIFVLASHSETYGMVTIEAMLSQLPIIATKSGGTSEILQDGKLGSLFEYENHDEFCNKLIWILNNKTEVETIALKAKRIAIEKYDQQIEIDAIDDLLKEI